MTPATPPACAPAAVGAGWTHLVGVDGGGTGTRARLQDRAGATLGVGLAGPSGLSQGVAQAWRHVDQAVAAAFAAAAMPLAPLAAPAAPAAGSPRAHIALGLGLAGAGVAALRAAFLAADPGYARCVLDTDAATQLAGAHGGRPGLVVAAGTGSVAAMRDADGRLRQAGGWGFPVGDEGSGAWLGLRAMQHAHAVVDGRAAPGPLSDTVFQAVQAADTTALLAWCAQAGQAGYAHLAPLVFGAAAAGDLHAAALLDSAAAELARLVQALQAGRADALPIAVVGSVGERLALRWPPALRARLVAPVGDSADGALRLLRATLAADTERPLPLEAAAHGAPT